MARGSGASAAVLAFVTAALLGCSVEKRSLGPSPPASPPTGPDDPRASHFQGNAYQIATGGRLFAWYGCQGCHGEEAKGAANLADDAWVHGGGIGRVYASIAHGWADGMPAYARRIPSEQIWQLTAFVRDLHKIPAVKRRRQDLDQAGEPQGANWTGAVR